MPAIPKKHTNGSLAPRFYRRWLTQMQVCRCLTAPEGRCQGEASPSHPARYLLRIPLNEVQQAFLTHLPKCYDTMPSAQSSVSRRQSKEVFSNNHNSAELLKPCALTCCNGTMHVSSTNPCARKTAPHVRRFFRFCRCHRHA